MCEEENVYFMGNENINNSPYLYGEDMNINGDKYEAEEENECETMYIKDILMQKDRQLFSMSEMDDMEIKTFPFIIGKSGGK